jgi:hypothetical protein
MNIFVTSNDPVKSAKHLDNKRVIKMILESAQILSTTINLTSGITAPYKSTHINHPCSIWARESRANYIWLCDHMSALCTEYTRRYGKVHKSQQYLTYFYKCAKHIPQKGFSDFVNCTDFKDEPNIFRAYKLHLINKWRNDKRKPSWKCKKIV